MRLYEAEDILKSPLKAASVKHASPSAADVRLGKRSRKVVRLFYNIRIFSKKMYSGIHTMVNI